jgi:hypothetical protein
MRHRQGPQLVAVEILGYMIVEKSTQVIYARLTMGAKHIPLVSIFSRNYIDCFLHHKTQTPQQASDINLNQQTPTVRYLNKTARIY